MYMYVCYLYLDDFCIVSQLSGPFKLVRIVESIRFQALYVGVTFLRAWEFYSLEDANAAKQMSQDPPQQCWYATAHAYLDCVKFWDLLLVYVLVIHPDRQGLSDKWPSIL
jgi:hypothetical protein